MDNTREKLIDIVEFYADFLDWDTKYYIVDNIMELFATDNNVGDKWISVKDRLPEEMEWVLCACVSGEVHILCYDYLMEDWDIHHRPNSCYAKGFVTHWMPLPEPPKGE